MEISIVITYGIGIYSIHGVESCALQSADGWAGVHWSADIQGGRVSGGMVQMVK